MMSSESTALLLIVLVFSSCTLSEKIKTTVTETSIIEGSCVTISCTYNAGTKPISTLLWFKDPEYVGNAFNGTILYSNTVSRPQSPGYSNRVEYMGGETEQKTVQNTDSWHRCDLRINDLRKTDSGNYSFRFIELNGYKYISEPYLNLTVTDNPCKVNIEPSEMTISVKESNKFTVRCSSSDSCLRHPEWLLQTPGQQKLTPLSSTNTITVDSKTKEGKKITELRFRPTWRDDNTILACRPAETNDHCLMRNVTLSVQYAPKEVSATVSPADVREGGSVNLTCTSRGRPNATVSWFKSRSKLSESFEWTRNNVTPEDSGKYYCKAANEHGVKYSNFIDINVKYGPKGVSVTPNVNVDDLKEGDELKLTCSVKDSNPAVNTFTWYLNNNRLPGQTSKFLINRVTPEHRGSYQCEASNGITSGTSTKLLVPIKYSPHQIKIQGETSVKIGAELSLTCSADANPPSVSYNWSHTGIESETLPLSVSAGALRIETVRIAHAGKYTCAVTNEIGTREESKEVNVLYPPLRPVLTARSDVREYEIISITCIVQSFPVSELTVNCPSDLQSIHKKPINRTTSNNVLTIYLNVTEYDAGDYQCTAENSEGTNQTKKTLKVSYAPKSVMVSSEGEQMEGHELTLACSARSVPIPSSYEWKKVVGGKLKILQNSQKLHFRSVQITDSGQYTCVAGNDIGKAESLPIDIRIKYLPRITLIHNMSAEGSWEHAVRLTCSVNAYPPPKKFHWFRLENKPALSLQQNLTVLPQNPGIYYCTATNDIGTSHSEHIQLFMRSAFAAFCQIFVPILLLLFLITLAIFLIRRNILKARLNQQSGADNPSCFLPMFLARSSTGSQNNTRENLSMADIPESCSGRTIYSDITLQSQDPTRTWAPNARPASSLQTSKQFIKIPQMREGDPKQLKHDDMANSSLNYANFEFKGKQDPAKRAPEGTDSTVYAKVSKHKPLKLESTYVIATKHSEPDQSDYENVSSACAPKLPVFTNMGWESDTSEEDEVNYTSVSYTAKTGLTEPKQKSSSGSSSSDDGVRTVYSVIKT